MILILLCVALPFNKDIYLILWETILCDVNVSQIWTTAALCIEIYENSKHLDCERKFDLISSNSRYVHVSRMHWIPFPRPSSWLQEVFLPILTPITADVERFTSWFENVCTNFFDVKSLANNFVCMI